MGAKGLDKDKADAILIDWRLGQLSQQQIAEKHDVSKGVVNKICKGVEQDAASNVTAGIQYWRGLKGHDDRMVTAIENEVTIQSKRLDLLAELAMDNVKQAMEAKCNGQADFRHRAMTINAAKENLVGKTPTVAVQVNQGGSGFSSVEQFKEAGAELLQKI